MTKLFIFLFLIFIAGLITNSSYAQTDPYVIDTQELKQDILREKPQAQAQSNSDANVIKGNNYEAILGFTDISSTTPLSIGISNSIADYGKLYPTNSIIREAELNINAESTHGYSVLTYENHPLLSLDNANLIPDTSCDAGLCTKSISAAWEDTLTYGLGYSCKDTLNSTCIGFDEDNMYKKFSDESKNEDYEAMLKSDESLQSRGKIVYKLNISASQENKVYTNTVNLILIPNL